VYDGDVQDIDEIGWDRFVSEVWESIFVGYRSASGIRTICRRWSDLLQGGLGCTEELADELVRDLVMIPQDRDLMIIRDPEQLLAAMHEVLGEVGAALAEAEAGWPPVPPAELAELLAAHARLCQFLRDGVADAAGESRS
jgi:hypothetical protein